MRAVRQLRHDGAGQVGGDALDLSPENNLLFEIRKILLRYKDLESMLPLRSITGVPKEFWVSLELSRISSAILTIVSLLSKSFRGASSDMEKFSSMELAVLSELSPTIFLLS